ncbi:hypothetical protein M9Y10_021693 [Tritrichomonas musculus]|uniref:Leucine Rich Repeat family protein n=1 Tax=Tritrichomonas musculus TaxID=1915356 RepID=A0ABR2KQF3_9EUKA
MTLSSLLKPSTKPMTLRATGAGVNTIDLLPPSKTGCLSLYISYNSISSLENISQFKNLKALLMDFNEISRIEDLRPLSKLKNLSILHLEGNPVCDLPLWDFHLLTLCPKLRVLNGQKTKDFLYSKSQIHHFLELESKFYQFIITAKYVIKVLKLKIMNPTLDFQMVAKITQRTMFKDPNFQNNYADNLRFHCAKVGVDGYFSLMRRKLLAQHQKINRLSKEANEPSKSHTILLDQIKLYTDFDAFIEAMQDLHDSALQVVGLGNGPVIVVQPKQDQFFLSHRTFKSKIERDDNQSNFPSNSQQASSVKDQIYSIEDYHPNDENITNGNNINPEYVIEEEETNEDFFDKIDKSNEQNDSSLNLEGKKISNDKSSKKGNEEDNTNQNEASEIKASLLSESNSQIDVNNQPNIPPQLVTLSKTSKLTKAAGSAADSVVDIQAPETAFSEIFAPNKKSQNKKVTDNEILSEPPDTPETRLRAQKSKEEFLSQNRSQSKNQDQIQNLNGNEMLSEASNNSFLSKNSNTNKSSKDEESKTNNENLDQLPNNFENQNLSEEGNNHQMQRQIQNDNQDLNESTTSKKSQEQNLNKDYLDNQILSENDSNKDSQAEDENKVQNITTKDASNEPKSENLQNQDQDTFQNLNEATTNKQSQESNSENNQKQNLNKDNSSKTSQNRENKNLNESESNKGSQNSENQNLTETASNKDPQNQEVPNLNENESNKASENSEINSNRPSQNPEIPNLYENDPNQEINNFNEINSNEVYQNSEQKSLNEVNSNESYQNSMARNLNENESSRVTQKVQNATEEEEELKVESNFKQKYDQEIDKIHSVLFNDNYSNEEENRQVSNGFEIKEREETKQQTIKVRLENGEEEEFVINENQDNFHFEFEIEEEEEEPNEGKVPKQQRKSSKSAKKKSQGKKENLPKQQKNRAISDADTDYAQSLSDTDTPGRPSSSTKKKDLLSQSEEPFIFEKSKSKSSFRSFDDSDSSVSNELKSILRYPEVINNEKENEEEEEEEKIKKTKLAISRPNINEKNKGLENPSSVYFEASSDKSSEFIDIRTPTHKVCLIPKDLMCKAFTFWKNRYRKINKKPDIEFVHYVQLLDELDETKSTIKKEKKVQLKSTSKHETQRGDQIRQISLKSELKRKIEHQKDINRALQKRLNQYISENESLQGFLDSPFDKALSTSFNMSYSQSSQSSKTRKKKKDTLTAQYCAMLREKK